ncbi:hypothetical protein ACROYT_G027679 [Oculina patagonica]
MERHGCGTINENGERLVEFCTINDLVIGGTLFPHREIHKTTWCSPNVRERNEIDHLLINGKRRRSLRDVKSCEMRFEALVAMDAKEDNIDDGVNRNWKNIVTAYSESSKACLGYRQRKPKEWMSPDTWKAIENRRRLKRKVMDSKSQRLKKGH